MQVIHIILGQRPHALFVSEDAKGTDADAKCAFVLNCHVLPAAEVIGLSLERTAKALFILGNRIGWANLLATAATGAEFLNIVVSRFVERYSNPI